MVVDDADGLHEGIADRGPAEFEAVTAHVFAHHIAQFSLGRQVFESLGFVDDSLPFREGPDIFIKGAEFFLDL